MQIKTTVRYHFTPVRMSSSKSLLTKKKKKKEKITKKNLLTINEGEDAEKREPSYTVGGNINWYNHYGQYGASFKKHRTTK